MLTCSPTKYVTLVVSCKVTALVQSHNCPWFLLDWGTETLKVLLGSEQCCSRSSLGLESDEY